jgi:thiamine biosynthesis lipoprotein
MFQVEAVKPRQAWKTEEYGSPLAQGTQAAMGTVMTHKAYGLDAEECLLAVQMEIERLNAMFSRFQPESEISLINQAAGQTRIAVSMDSLAVLARSLEFSNDHPELFRITIGPLMDLWRAARKKSEPPPEDAVKKVLPLVNDQDVMLDPEPGTAGLRHTGQGIDLGGIAKGYAARRVLEIYNAYGIQSACSNLGGNVATLGSKPDGSAWRIGIQHPKQAALLIGNVSVENESVVSSGDYQRYFVGRDGKRYHHILDPVHGMPCDSGLTSVSIVAADAVSADALSTMVFIAGLEKGSELLASYPLVNAILVDAALNVWITRGLKDRFQKTGNSRIRILNL